MFERYTERARRVLFFARYEATQLGSTSIETEHLLLGLVREGKGVTGRLFAHAHLSLEDIRKEIEGRSVIREKVSTSVEIPFRADTKRVLRYAAEEADGLLHTHIGTEHLLLGILREEASVASTFLRESGLDLQAVRAQVALLQVEEEGRSDQTPAGPRPPGVHVTRSLRTWHAGVSVTRSSVSWTLASVGLRVLLAEAYDIGRSRIDLPPALDDRDPYEVVLVLTRPEDVSAMTVQMRAGIERHFGTTITRQRVLRPVLVMTAPAGSIRAEQVSSAASGGLGAISWQVGIEALDEPIKDRARRIMEELAGPAARQSTPIGGVSGVMSIADLCRTLEDWLGQPVIDETHLEGTFRFDVRAAVDTNEGFLDTLRDQVGLVATLAQREVEILVVKPA